jgi:hypothetical protein
MTDFLRALIAAACITSVYMLAVMYCGGLQP